MAETCTVVLGAQKHLEALRELAAESGEVLTFTDTDAPAALEAITKRRPQVIILERFFAATSRGATLINRIKADPALESAEIRVVSHDGEYSRVSPRRASAAPAKAKKEVEAPAPPPVVQQDYRMVRRSPRVRIADGVDAQVDGAPAKLVDLSTIGAQVIVDAALKPNQRVRVSLSDNTGVVRFNANVAWAFFEMPKGVTRYRAGIEFHDAKPEAVEAFAARHKS
jgi:CheY-like chemotaxis protein